MASWRDCTRFRLNIVSMDYGLVGRFILFNWVAAGWCLGEIARVNADGRRIVEKGVPANFFVYYEIDEEEGLQCTIRTDEYGGDEDFSWAMLEPVAGP